MNSPTKIAAGIAAVLVFASPFAASAVTLEDLQNQVNSLLKQIAQFQTQTTVSTTVSSNIAQPQYRICGILNRNLNLGIRGDDVSGLQEFLQGQGYLAVNPTGYFGPMTAQAVAKWQTSEGVTAAGAFGPLSRERLKIKCGGGWGNAERFSASPTSGSAPLSVTFSTWLSGFHIDTISYTVDYGDGSSEPAANCNAPADACISPGQNTHTYTADGTYTATLNKITNTCPPGAQCFAGPISQVIGKVQIQVGGSSACKPVNYMPILCSDGAAAQPKHNEAGCIIGYECPVANYTPPANCKAWNDGCNICSRTSPDSPAACTLRACFAAGKGYCSTYFDTTSGNKSPVISGLSGPTTLALNTTGTWTIKASDPEGGSLSYQVWWGDENVYAPMMNSAGAARDFVQSSTFTHAYANSGTYTVSVSVTDDAGLSAKTSTTVQVGNGGVACTMEYAPVCAQPPEPACRHSLPACMMATPGPATYSNRCMMNAAGATFISNGACATAY